MSSESMNTSSKPDISRYPVPDLDSLPDDIRERILAVQKKLSLFPMSLLCWHTVQQNLERSLRIMMPLWREKVVH